MTVHIFLGIWATVVPQNSSVGSRSRGGAQLSAAVAAKTLAHENIIYAYDVFACLVFVYAFAHDLKQFFGNDRGIYVGECLTVEVIYARVFLLLQHKVYGIYGERVAAVFNSLVVKLAYNVGDAIARRICLKYMQKYRCFFLVYGDFGSGLLACCFMTIL